MLNINPQRVALITVFTLLTLGSIVLPQNAQAQSQCPTPQPLYAGYTAYVLPGEPNAVRDIPGTTSPSRVIGSIAGGEAFTVLSATPTCVDGLNWWQVRTETLVGWTADGTLNEAWVAPLICNNAPLPRMRPGMSGVVLPGDPNTIRPQPNSGTRLGTIPADGEFSVIGGPSCGSSGRVWYQVNYNGVVGWTAEGEGSTYWLRPANGVPPFVPPPNNPPINTTCTLAPRLASGFTGMVVPGLPNALRNQPGLEQSGSTVIGNLQQGAIFTVLSGPVCRDGYNWYQVTAGGATGWTAEGENGVYWLDPLVCANGLVSRLAPGMRARVTPGLPNRVRTLPNISSGVIVARIPAGSSAFVLNNFHCDIDGRLWWQVAYFGRIGWTAEGENGVYWLEPT